MVTKEDIKKEIDKLPEGVLEEVYDIIKRVYLRAPSQNKGLTRRNFQGKLDKADIRRAAYE